MPPSMAKHKGLLLMNELSHDRQAGVMEFHDYAAMAEKEGIIALGGWQGMAWIALLEQWV